MVNSQYNASLKYELLVSRARVLHSTAYQLVSRTLWVSIYVCTMTALSLGCSSARSPKGIVQISNSSWRSLYQNFIFSILFTMTSSHRIFAIVLLSKNIFLTDQCPHTVRPKKETTISYLIPNGTQMALVYCLVQYCEYTAWLGWTRLYFRYRQYGRLKLVLRIKSSQAGKLVSVLKN